LTARQAALAGLVAAVVASAVLANRLAPLTSPRYV